ncbi:hypothetical protein SEA_MARIOKART_65 [Gordonia phage Mariokart]|nr:hypothetical protein SEA_MARIOKART_65 [Gordonia phage Mariokart]
MSTTALAAASVDRVVRRGRRKFTLAAGVALTTCGVQVAHNDVLGAYPLTPCCGATGKGSADASTGVVCRACYREVGIAYGDCGWAAVEMAAAEAGCPCSGECADYTLAQFDRED